MHPPGQFPNGSVPALHRPMTHFERQILPQMSGQPLHCVQSAGDAIYVPDGWAHATINVEPTLGLAWQRPTSEISTCAHGGSECGPGGSCGSCVLQVVVGCV